MHCRGSRCSPAALLSATIRRTNELSPPLTALTVQLTCSRRLVDWPSGGSGRIRPNARKGAAERFLADAAIKFAGDKSE
jgi:hypothetical protein